MLGHALGSDSLCSTWRGIAVFYDFLFLKIRCRAKVNCTCVSARQEVVTPEKQPSIKNVKALLQPSDR